MMKNILGCNVFSGSLQACCDEVINSIFNQNKKTWLACLNPHSFVVAQKNYKFYDALKSADWLVPDGVGIVWASWFLGDKISERVTGPDMFLAITAALQRRGGASVFFLGSSEDVLARIQNSMKYEWPAVRVAGTYSPPFKMVFSDFEKAEMIQQINAVKPDVLWVGLSAPKQEELIREILPKVNVRFAAAVGAVFDFYAGSVTRSHPIYRRFGLEWLPRLIRQPRRLWRRTFVSAPIFVSYVLREKIFTKKDY